MVDFELVKTTILIKTMKVGLSFAVANLMMVMGKNVREFCKVRKRQSEYQKKGTELKNDMVLP